MGMKDKKVTVFGGSGFLGSYVVQRLAKEGAIVNVASRNPAKCEHVMPAGPVGQIKFTSCDVKKIDDIEKNTQHSDFVINLVGILFPKGKQKFACVHAQAAGHIAQTAKKENVKMLVHVSALGVDKAKKSNYAKTKLNGENAVLTAFPEATILRPSIMFGSEDHFFNLFASFSSFSPILPLIGGGKTQFQPVYVCDVADAVIRALKSHSARGKIYELGGPKTYNFKELMQYMLNIIQRKRILMPIPFPIAIIEAYFLELLPKPPLTRDQVNLLKTDNVLSEDSLGLEDLGIQPTSMDAVVPSYLERYVKKTY